jgi:hypothetical protein
MSPKLCADIRAMTFLNLRLGDDRQQALEELGEPPDFARNKHGEIFKYGSVQIFIERATNRIDGIVWYLPLFECFEASDNLLIDSMALELAACTKDDLKRAFGDDVRLDEKLTYEIVDGPEAGRLGLREHVMFIFDEQGKLEKVGLWPDRSAPANAKKK